MIIGIDTRISENKKTGIGHMLNNIIPEIISLDKKNNYKLVGSSLGLKEANLKIFSFRRLFQRILNFLWKKVFFPPVNFLIGKTDIFFFTNFVDFPVRAKKRILMIIDMSFIKYPEFTEKKNLLFLKKGIKGAIKRADKILTISENAKKEIVAHYSVSENLVEVIYLDCNKNIELVRDNSKIEKIKGKYKISGKYIIFVGTLEPRKNIRGLIEAYNNLNDDLKGEYKLVICGGRGWYYNEIFDIVKEKNIEDRVIFTGYTNDKDISSLYSGASLLVHVPFYEGFGLTILEGFKCEVPVVCADNSSLKEVGGDAVIYCKAENTKSITQSIESVLRNEKLKKELISKGKKQLEKFSWERSAKKIVEIFESI